LRFCEEYIARLGLPAPPAPDAAGLKRLHAAHLRSVPFENLSIHLNEPVSLDFDELADKLLRRGRGGFCYELNGLFAELLVRLGYRVTLLAAMVWSGDQLGPPLDHLALRVQCDGDPTVWLVDVGFGAHSLFPLRLAPGEDQRDPGGSFRLEPTDAGNSDDFDVLRNGAAQYRVEAHPRILADFRAMCFYKQTSPLSHFTRSVVCTMQTKEGRITLSGDRLIETDAAGNRHETDQEILKAYRERFGIELDRLPVVRPVEA